jgi:hypothetical protein
MRFQGSPIAFVAFFDDTRGMSVAPFIRYEYDTVLLPRGKCSLPQLTHFPHPMTNAGAIRQSSRHNWLDMLKCQFSIFSLH